MFSAFFPERSGEHKQDGEQLETAYEHEQGAQPFGSGRQGTPGVGWSKGAEGRTDVANATYRNAIGFEKVKSHNHENKPPDEDKQEVEASEG